MRELNEFSEDSGLRTSFEKCLIIRAGPWKDTEVDLPFAEKDEIKLLGSFIAGKPSLYYKENRKEILRRIRSGILDFHHFNPRIPEKITAWNSYILSKVGHLFRVTPYDPRIKEEIDIERNAFVMTTPSSLKRNTKLLSRTAAWVLEGQGTSGPS